MTQESTTPDLLKLARREQALNAAGLEG